MRPSKKRASGRARRSRKPAPVGRTLERFARVRRVLDALPALEKRVRSVANAKLTSPSFDRMLEASVIVRDYVVKHKRKVYGGLAINHAIAERDASLALYDADDFPDMDFYTSDALGDVKNICDLLVAAGFENVLAESAVHEGTYKIRADFYDREVADVTYVWSRFYNMIPTRAGADGVLYVSPHYQAIDLYRPFCDFQSWHKIAKNVWRAAVLERLYLRLPDPKPRQAFRAPPYPAAAAAARDGVLAFLRGRSDAVVVDAVAYNAMLTFANVGHLSERLVAVEDVKVYVGLDGGRALVDAAVKHLGLKKGYAVQTFQQLLEHHRGMVRLVVGGVPVLSAYAEAFCLPYQAQDGLRLGSYHLVLRFLYIMRFHHNVEHDAAQSSRYTYMLMQLQHAREHYLSRHGLAGVEPGLLQELQAECMGDAFENAVIAARRRKVAKKSFYYRAGPNARIPADYRYPNTSGRMIEEAGPDGISRKVDRA